MQLDEAHRIVLDALDISNRFDDTILVFVSDNGANMAQYAIPAKPCRYGFNYPLRGAKYSWWEGAIRTIGFAFSNNYIHPAKRGSNLQQLITAVDWKKTLIQASGEADISEIDGDGIGSWAAISGYTLNETSPELPRSEMPLQIWLETKRYVILFFFQGTLWKIMHGYPAAISGAGTEFKTMPLYSLSAIEQPAELPRAELTNTTDPGLGKRFECSPQCLSNLSENPQELQDWAQAAPEALAYGNELISKYHEQGLLVSKTGLCQPGFYSLPTLDVTDRWSITQAQKCSGWIPWLDSQGKPKSECS